MRSGRGFGAGWALWNWALMQAGVDWLVTNLSPQTWMAAYMLGNFVLVRADRIIAGCLACRLSAFSPGNERASAQ